LYAGWGGVELSAREKTQGQPKWVRGRALRKGATQKKRKTVIRAVHGAKTPLGAEKWVMGGEEKMIESQSRCTRETTLQTHSCCRSPTIGGGGQQNGVLLVGWGLETPQTEPGMEGDDAT